MTPPALRRFATLGAFAALLLLTAAPGRAQLPGNLHTMDRDFDGEIARFEAKGNLDKNFDRIDCDKSNALTLEEIKKFNNGKSCGEAGGKPDAKAGGDGAAAGAFASCARDYAFDGGDHKLELPPGEGPFPVVVISHGMGGAGPIYTKWAKQLNQWGYAAFVLDHYGPRGYDPATCQVKGPDAFKEVLAWRVRDAVPALKYVAAQPRIDRQRMVVGGWSAGGVFALAALTDEKIAKKAGLAAPVKAGVLFYPMLATCKSFPMSAIGQPVLYLAGAEDGNHRLCWADEGLEKIKSPGADQVVKVYPDACHLFDVEPLKDRKTVQFQSGESSCLQYNENAYQQSVADLHAFLDRYVGSD